MIQIRKKNAFTLVELLVVISIMAILLAILVPALSKAREQAKNLKCIVNLSALGKAFYQYNLDYKKIPMYSWAFDESSWPGPSQEQLDDFVEAGQLWKYVQTREVFLCPSTPKSKQPGPFGHSGYWWGFPPYWSYCINAQPAYSQKLGQPLIEFLYFNPDKTWVQIA